ncbi:MAG: diguanylate cyclase [Butyrivibrio sp.]|nr:diguanylate cyclase [Butyrivibrio sp.]
MLTTKEESGLLKKNSVRTRILSLFVVLALFISVTQLLISIIGINILNRRDSDQLLEHLGRESASNINKTLELVQHSVDNVYFYAYDQLEELFGKLFGQTFREEYLDKVAFLSITEADNIEEVMSFYYRLTTDIKDTPCGFLYIRGDDGKFYQQPLMDIEKYDRADTEHVGWYWVPRRAKEPVWLGPYYNQNLNARVMSYIVPVYVYGRFAGVIGMDIDVEKFCEELQDITAYNTGSAVLFDVEENILYGREHSDGLNRDDFTSDEDRLLNATNNALFTDHPAEYSTTHGQMKVFACKLINGMTLSINAPLDEINATRTKVMRYSVLICVILLAVSLGIMYYMINRSLQPLQELDAATRKLSDPGRDREIRLSYQGDDEIGQLTRTFRVMSEALKHYFKHVHSLAYTDALTNLNNKASYEIIKEVHESEVQMGCAEFSVVVMDVNNLKQINDTIGHEKGDLLLQHVAACMRKVFVGYPLYRIGGDEFCAIINNDARPQDLIDRLQYVTAQQSEEDMEIFQCSYQVAAGAATYVRGEDKCFEDVFARADQLMYDNKKNLKARERERDSGR